MNTGNLPVMHLGEIISRKVEWTNKNPILSFVHLYPRQVSYTMGNDTINVS